MLSKLFISSLFATVAFANTMHLNSNFGKCMDVRGGVFANGTPVQMYVLSRCWVRVRFIYFQIFSFDCNGTPAQQWTFNPGFTKVQVTGTNFCLDAGSSESESPAHFVWMVWLNIMRRPRRFCRDEDMDVLRQSSRSELGLHFPPRKASARGNR